MEILSPIECLEIKSDALKSIRASLLGATDDLIDSNQLANKLERGLEFALQEHKPYYWFFLAHVNRKASCQVSLQYIDKAIRSFCREGREKWNEAISYWFKGELMLCQNDEGKALIELQKAMKIIAGVIDLEYSLGNYEAIGYFRKILSLIVEQIAKHEPHLENVRSA